MIDKSQIIETVLKKVEKLPVGHYLVMLTYKRNRSVFIVRTGMDDLLILEKGYHCERFEVQLGKLKGVLKILVKREFPRSRKIRLHTMGLFVEEKAIKTSWKVL